jgi:hypothetical protein
MRRPILSILLLLFAAPVDGQTPPLESGAPLRVHARGFTLSGELVRLDTDTLVLRPAGATTDLRSDRAIAVSDVLRLDRKVPRTRGRGAARGALWGGVIGAVVGAVAGAADEPNDSGLGAGWTRTDTAQLGAAVLGGLGAGVGALIGTVWPGTRWEPTTLDATETR